MKKNHLLAPGPTPVPQPVLEAMAKPLFHHRTSEFESHFADIRDGLEWLYQVKSDVISLASSGTGGMEACVSNLLSVGEKVLVVEGGKFGERWSEICQAYGVIPDVLSVIPGHSVNITDLEAKLIEGNYSAVLIQASETSTGSKHDIQGVSQSIKKASPDTLLVVDAITALGVYDVQPEDWGLDAVVTGSQKALMLPPGLAFVWLSENAWKRTEKSNCPSYYFNLEIERKSQKKNTTAWTPAISLMMGLKVALSMMQEEGLEKIYQRHAKLSKSTREAIESMGLNIFTKDLIAECLTAVEVPQGINGKDIPKKMQSDCGVTIAGGQGELSDKIFRIGHLGYVDGDDVLVAVSALEKTLLELGCKFKKSVGIAAAQRSLLQ
tara:strand:- start:10832 stop:11971 length:1140 start_codon:yes stop_codon:yes gene_type:complete